jgi:nitrogen fixation/metabolism regulation signal transduction histidine kinase
LIVFFTIPVVLLVVLGIFIFQVFADFFHRRPGSKFNIRLLTNFTIIVIFSITPATIMATTAINQIIIFWHNIDTPAGNSAANSFAAEYFSLHRERFYNIINNYNYTNPMPIEITSVQVFRLSATADKSAAGGQNETWTEISFTGNETFHLSSPPIHETGFPARELPRDHATIRYVHRSPNNIIHVFSYNLGDDFDRRKAAIENQIEHFERISDIRTNIRPLLIYYYVVFFLPTLLMTVIIAISLTRRITNPIVELTEAIQRVAAGNFSIQILTRRDDELGILIRSFNSMVQDLEKSREALVRSEKISIWQNMAQQLAHEIKNPLTPIKLSAERVLRRWRNDPENIGAIIESSMMAIIQETEGLSTLLNEFRTLSKPMEPSNSLTLLHEPVEELINTYTNSFPAVKFDIEHLQTNIMVKIDKNRLSQILTNLIINAIDAMNGSGLIELRTDLVKKREVCYCRISVKDSGKGIDKKENRLVFTPYFTTKESGTGLGLPIVERIVNDHNGTIWFDSAEGVGTTFYIDLPVELKENV